MNPVQMLEVLEGMVATLWLMLPVYVPNPGAVIFGGGTPMDFGRKFYDGRRILGKSKTWRGFFGGSLLGFSVGLVQNYLSSFLPQEWFPPFSNDWGTAILLVLTLSFSSLLGDATGSFIKRRLGIESGGRAFLLDQLPFVIVAWIFAFLLFPDWFLRHFWNPVAVATVFVVTPLLHRSVNIAAYKLGYKDVPW